MLTAFLLMLTELVLMDLVFKVMLTAFLLMLILLMLMHEVF